MNRTGPDTWSLILTGVPVFAFQYKFTLGSWNVVARQAPPPYAAKGHFSQVTRHAT